MLLLDPILGLTLLPCTAGCCLSEAAILTPEPDPIPMQETGTKWDADLERQLCYEVKTFLLAGHETSAAMLCWSVFELSQNQEHMNKVRRHDE